MPRPKTHEERARIINRIIELVKEHGRITTKDVVAMFGLHRVTAEKYLRQAMAQGGLYRQKNSGIFRNERAAIDFDLQRYSSGKETRLPPLTLSPVMGRVLQIFEVPMCKGGTA